MTREKQTKQFMKKKKKKKEKGVVSVQNKLWELLA